METAFVARAKHARACIRRMQQPERKAAAAEYLNAVKGLAAEIRMISLGQALATLRAKSEKPGNGFQQLFEDVESWVRECKIYTTQPPLSLFDALIDGDKGKTLEDVQQKYCAAFAEIDDYLAILKGLSEVFLVQKKAPAGTDNPQPADAQ